MKIQDTQKPTQKQKKKREIQGSKAAGNFFLNPASRMPSKGPPNPKEKTNNNYNFQSAEDELQSFKRRKSKNKNQSLSSSSMHPSTRMLVFSILLSLSRSHRGIDPQSSVSIFFSLPGVLDLEGKLLGIARGN
jgi:hypothetical protein